MSAQAEVAPPPGDPSEAGTAGTAGGVLRVKPPSPLPPRRRAVLAIVVVALVVAGSVLVLEARSHDGDEVPGATWRTLPVPRAARVDPFDGTGGLGAVDGFGTWQTGAGTPRRIEGVLGAEATAVATVDTGSPDVLVQAQFLRAARGSGLVLSSTADASAGLVLRAAGEGRWELVWQRSGSGPQVLASFDAPTADVSARVVRQGDQLTVAFDDQTSEVDAPAGSAAGTSAGVVVGAGTEIDLFGYLPLDPG
jgi:hypothetical protein